MRKNKLSKDTRLFTAFISSSDYHNTIKMQEMLWEIFENIEGIAFTFVDRSQFPSETQKLFRKKRFDLLIIDAYKDEDATNIQTIQYAKEINPNVKIIVLTSILTEEIRAWKENKLIDGFQLVPFQKVPFLKNIREVLLGKEEHLTIQDDAEQDIEVDDGEDDEEIVLSKDNENVEQSPGTENAANEETTIYEYEEEFDALL